MATIPLGNFGNQVAAPGQAAAIPRGNPIGQAGLQLGQTALEVAGDMATQQTRLDAQERQRQVEAAEAAERGREALALQTTQDALTDLRDSVTAGVREGKIPKDKAESEWAAQANKLTSKASEQFRPQNRPLVLARLQGVAGRFGNDVRKAREERDRQDVTVSLDGILESAQREYTRDPVGAEAKVRGALDSLGPQSLYTPEALAKKGQAWKENAQFTMAYEAVSRGRGDRAALQAAEEVIGSMDALDSQKRAVLTDRLMGYRMHLDQQDELRQQRAARQAEATMRKAAAEFETFQTLADKGTVLAPDYVDRVILATAGTPYQAGIRALAQQARETGGLAAMPVARQQAMLDQIDALIATQGRTPELDKRRQQVEKVLKGSMDDLKTDPLRAGVERGVLQDLAPLNLAAGFESVAQQIATRVAQAETVRQWAGRPVSPFTPDEAQTMGKMLATLPPDQRGNSIAALASTLPSEQITALAAQIAPNDRALGLAMAVGAAKTTAGRTTAELVLRGAQAIKDKAIKEEQGAEFGVRATIAKEVGDAVPAAARQDVIDTARFIYLGKQAAGESISEAGAVRLAIGGDLVEHNGRRVPIPAGMDAEAFRQRLMSMTPASLANQVPDSVVYLQGGRNMGLPEFLARLPDAQLEPVGYGRYMVRSGGSLAMNAQRQPIVVGVK